MTYKIIECEQGSPEWFAARLGIPTASEFKTIVGIKKDARDKLTRKKYMRKLAGEIITGEQMATYTNPDMERGKIMEAQARYSYAFENDIYDLKKVGFIRSGNTGCSPDSLVGENGGLEIKTAQADVQIERLETGTLPPDSLACRSPSILSFNISISRATTSSRNIL